MSTLAAPRRGRVVALASLGLAAATALTACTAESSDGPDGGTVAYGASAADYQAALADMEPVELIVQSDSASADNSAAQTLQLFLDRVTEYSGGKITWDITYANGILSNPLEFDDALVDGRLDMAQFFPQYDAAEYPANNDLLNLSVLRDPQLVTGWYAGTAAITEIGLSTPEVVAEWSEKGIIPLKIMNIDGPVIIACNQPVTTLAELQGKQIRSGGPVHSRQIEGLGAIPVSLPYGEVYEALQRGILDCVMSAHMLVTSGGMLEVAPYIMHTDTASFAATPTNYYAGPRIGQLPQAAQQLIVESAQLYAAAKIVHNIENLTEDRAYTATMTQLAEYGGDWLAFDPEVDAALQAVNDEIIADVRATANFDGEDVVDRAEAAFAAWGEKVNELGYVDAGPVSAFPDWYAEVSDDAEPWFNAVVADILTEYSPV